MEKIYEMRKPKANLQVSVPVPVSVVGCGWAAGWSVAAADPCVCAEECVCVGGGAWCGWIHGVC